MIYDHEGMLMLIVWVDVKLSSISNEERIFINENYCIFWNNGKILFPQMIKLLYLNISPSLFLNALGKITKLKYMNLLENPVLYILKIPWSVNYSCYLFNYINEWENEEKIQNFIKNSSTDSTEVSCVNSSDSPQTIW